LKTILQWWYCNGIATVLQRYLQLETIYSFQESFEGKRLCNDNFRFTEKLIPFCQETIIVSIRLQRFNLERLPNLTWTLHSLACIDRSLVEE
jgi:hypothetical protein